MTTEEMDEIMSIVPARPDAREALTELSETLRTALSAVQGFDPVKATAAQRQEMVYFRNFLLDAFDPIKVWLDRIDAMFRLAAERSGARQFPLGDGTTVTLEDAQTGYEVQEREMRAALLELERDGLITRAEIDEAIPAIITYKADNRRLNALAKNRGTAVTEAIESHRRKIPADPSRSKVTYPRRQSR